MRSLRWGMGVIAAVLISAGAFADDVSSLKAELADLKAKVASMEATQMAPAAGGDAESLTSMKKKGSIKIGGGVDIPILVVNRDDNPLIDNGEGDEIDSTTFMGEAALKFDIKASNDTSLKIKLDLEDFWDNGVDQDDLLEECYFVWKNVAGSAWKLSLGKKEVKAFGQDNSVGYIDGFVHGGSTLFDMGEEDENNSNDHETVGTNSLPGEVDNTFQIEGIYSYKDLAKVYLAVFQNKKSRGMHEDRSDDTLFFQSFAAKLELTPVEGLTIEASFINMHNDSKGDAKGANEADQQALSVGFDYNFKGLPLEIFGEYLHGWDWDYNDNRSTDTFQLGMVYGVTEAIDLGIMGEYANIDTDNVAAGSYTDEDYYNFYMTAYYKFDSGVSVGLEYQHNWYDGNRKTANDVDADADMIGFVTHFSF